jgi:autotransporter-associated beta strand protein
MKRKLLLSLLLASALPAMAVTWDGGGPTTNWTEALNWSADIAPVAGDPLVFDGSVGLTNANDFAAGTSFAGITWASTAGGNFVHTGNSINLAGNLDYAKTSGTATASTPFALQQNVSASVASGGTLNLNGAVSGGFSFTKSGGGLLAAGVAFTHTGGLSVGGGTFRTTMSGNTSGTLGSGAVSISNNSVLELRSTTSTTFNNALVVGTGGGQIHVRSNHGLNPSSITGTGTLTLKPTGSDNLVLTTADMKGWSGSIEINRNGRNNFGLRLATAFVNNSLANASITLTDNTYISRQNGTNSTATIDIGTLSSADTTATVGGSAAGTGTFFYSIGSRNENSTYAGAINNGGTKTGLVKVGSAVLTLSGTSTYTGTTTVSAGTLLVNGSLGATTVSVTGGTLGGTGTIAGDVTVNSGAKIAPGASIESLQVASAVINGTLVSEFDGTGAGTIDLLSVTGLLDITNATVDFDLLSGGAALNDSSYIFATYGSLTGSAFANVIDLPSGYSINYAFNDGISTKNIALVAVPEPGAALLGGIGLLALLRRRRN